ncbi:putative Heat shock protein 70 family [Helianthus annuus]|nr:putative Heat shock protein 70 family [Helianthus annuus]
MKLWPFKVVAGKGDKPKIVVTYKNEIKEFAAEEISSMVLAKMKGTVETFLGSEVEKAVVTVPAYFSDSQRQSTKDAAMVSGLEVLRMIHEPTAAAIVYALDKRANVDGKMNVIVFDLGGGTFDVSILTIDDAGVIEVKAMGGDTHLGGEDFDNRMVNYYVSEIKRKHKVDISKSVKALGRLRVSCERAKRTISTASQITIDIECLFNGIDFSTKFTRAKFEEVNMELFKKCMAIVKTYLQYLNMKKDSIDEVVLVSGSTRIPKIQVLLQEFFLMERYFAKESIPMTLLRMTLELIDITPLSLGVGGDKDVMLVLIPRNLPIPTKKEYTFYTIFDNQTYMDLLVYQVEVTVCFTIDANGILHVSAREATSGSNNAIKITNKGGLTKDDIKKMIEDAKRYKLEDEAHMKKVMAHEVLTDYVYKLRDNIKDYKVRMRLRETALSVKELKEIDQQIDDAIEWLDEHPDAEVVDLEDKEAELNNICRLTNV